MLVPGYGNRLNGLWVVGRSRCSVLALKLSWLRINQVTAWTALAWVQIQNWRVSIKTTKTKSLREAFQIKKCQNFGLTPKWKGPSLPPNGLGTFSKIRLFWTSDFLEMVWSDNNSLKLVDYEKYKYKLAMFSTTNIIMLCSMGPHKMIFWPPSPLFELGVLPLLIW